MTLEPWYLTGMVELAGSFTYSRSDRNVVPYFAIKLRNDEGGILDDVQAHFGGAGRQYALKGSHPGPRSRYYRVTRIQDLDLIVQHFDDYPLRGRKAAAYTIWRELVSLKRQGYRKPEREKIEKLCTSLSAALR